MDELISVIVPVYKAEAYLDECVTSILGQTYRNLELILVDDGSPDNSGAMCDAWARRDTRVRVIHQQNAGPGAARNTGIEAARGTYLAFVDSDDTVSRVFLSTLHEAIGKTQLAVCGLQSEEETVAVLDRETVDIDTFRATPSKYVATVYVNMCYNKLYKTEILQQKKICMDTTMRWMEDLCFVTQYLLQCQQISIVPDVLYYYRKNDSSIMHTFAEGTARDAARGMKAQECLFLPQNELSPREADFFLTWKYGSIQAVLRYILAYAPAFSVMRKEIGELLREPVMERVYTDETLCRKLGRKKLVYGWLARHHAYGVLTVLFRLFGVAD